MEDSFYSIKTNGMFIVSVVILFFGYYLLNIIIKDFFGPHYVQRPEYLRHGYLLSLFISVLWFLAVPVLQLYAKQNYSYYSDSGPWYGNIIILIFIGVVIFAGGVILSYLYYRR